MFSAKDRLDRIKKGVKGQRDDTGIVTSIYYLIKELKCLPDIVGREYEVEYDKMGRIKKIRQLPIKIPTLFTLFNEMKKDYIKQEKEAKKMKRGRRRR